ELAWIRCYRSASAVPLRFETLSPCGLPTCRAAMSLAPSPLEQLAAFLAGTHPGRFLKLGQRSKQPRAVGAADSGSRQHVDHALRDRIGENVTHRLPQPFACA